MDKPETVTTFVFPVRPETSSGNPKNPKSRPLQYKRTCVYAYILSAEVTGE